MDELGALAIVALGEDDDDDGEKKKADGGKGAAAGGVALPSFPRTGPKRWVRLDLVDHHTWARMAM